MNKMYSLEDLDQPVVLEPSMSANSAVIWLHGLGADGHDFAGILPQLNLPKDHGIRFIFPHAPVQPVTVNGGMTMRSWYDIYSMTIAEKIDIEGINQSAGIVKELIEQQMSKGISPHNIILAGFSQGGLVVLHAALHSDHALAGVLALSTYYPAECYQQSDKNGHQTPVFMAHGTYDQVIPLNVAEKSHGFLQSIDCETQWHTYPMEHSVCSAEIDAIASWLRLHLNQN